jgi:hypothetical protein
MRLAPALAAAIITFAPLTCLAAGTAIDLSDLPPAASQVRSQALDVRTATGQSQGPAAATSALSGVGGTRGLDVRLRRLERSGLAEARYEGERSQHAGFGVDIPMGRNATLTSGYELSRREDGLGDGPPSAVDLGFRIGASLQF